MATVYTISKIYLSLNVKKDLKNEFKKAAASFNMHMNRIIIII